MVDMVVVIDAGAPLPTTSATLLAIASVMTGSCDAPKHLAGGKSREITGEEMKKNQRRWRRRWRRTGDVGKGTVTAPSEEHVADDY